jgi:hypothetical protein
MTELRWVMIVVLAAAGLLRPVLSIVGAYDGRRPWAPLLVTALIAVLWVVVVVLGRAPRPVLTLTLVGAGYGVLALLLNLALQPLLASAEPIPVPGIVAMIVFSGGEGAVLGLVAAALRRRRSLG